MLPPTLDMPQLLPQPHPGWLPSSHASIHPRIGPLMLPPRAGANTSALLALSVDDVLYPRVKHYLLFFLFLLKLYLYIFFVVFCLIHLFISLSACLFISDPLGRLSTSITTSALTAIPIISTAVARGTTCLLMPSAALPLTPASTADSRKELQGVIVSPSLLPFPERVTEKVQQGQYVDLREMMPDNAALFKMLADVSTISAVQAGSQVRDIEDPLTWTFYFLALIAVSVEDRRAQHLAAYAQLIIHLSQRHGGRGWLAYDRLFRQQAAAGSPHPWNQLAPSLIASTVMSSGHPKFTPCELCNGADHSTTQCALFPASAASKTLPPLSLKGQKLMSPAEGLIGAPATRAPPLANTHIPAQSAELNLMLPSTAWGDPRTATTEEGGVKLHLPVLPPPPLKRVSSYP